MAINMAMDLDCQSSATFDTNDHILLDSKHLLLKEYYLKLL